MHESAHCYHNLEWPAPDARVAGPVVWLRGWVVGKPGHDFTDVRVCSASGIHLGVLGLPRIDLATYFKARQPWLPAEFVIGVPVTDGPVMFAIEGQDSFGEWHLLQNLPLAIAADGESCPQEEGKLIPRPGGSWTTRGAHLPFHGHLDEPEDEPSVRFGRIDVFGWLLHETQPVRAVLATTDGLVFNTVESGLTDDLLATKVPQHAAAHHARLRGEVDVPPTLTSPCCLRVYAHLADGSTHLCFARRLIPRSEEPAARQTSTPHPIAADTSLPPLASGRPRRLLFIVRTLQPDDATLRALDVVHHLAKPGRWVTRLVATEDGPLRRDFEENGCPVQIVDPRAFFAATHPADIETSLRAIGREIWWHHLDAVVIFDPLSTWARTLAQQNGIPIFDDPADSLAWFARAPAFKYDPSASIVAPIRGQADQGANVLLRAADHLARHFPTRLDSRKIDVTDSRKTREEILFQADLAANTAAMVTHRPCPRTAAAFVCPAFTGHPQRTLLSALAAGIPLITTPAPLLTAVFGPNELSYVVPGNPLALAHAIVDVLANPAATGRRTEAAWRIVIGTYAPAVQLPRWEKLLETAVSR